MQLIFELSCGRPLLDEIPNNFQLVPCTRLKTLRVMEDKVAPFICNLMFNIMNTSLIVACVTVSASLLNDLAYLN